MRAKILAGRAGPGVERDDADIVGAHENPAAAGGILGRLIVGPISHAAAGVTVSGTLAA